MTAEPETPARLNALVERLSTAHAGRASREDVITAVQGAVEAVQMFGAVDGDAEMLGLAERIAERDLLLRLGLEREVARLDPESRSTD